MSPDPPDYRRPVILRPSSAHIWMKCSMQPWLLSKNRDYIPIPTGDESWTQEGTDAHERAKQHLRGKVAIRDKKDPVSHYVRHVESQYNPESRLLVEISSPTHYDKHYEGTVDAARFVSNGEQLDIVDLKYGEGQEVEAIGNPQMAIYWRSLYDSLTTLGLMEHMEMDVLVKLTICQPRHWHAQRTQTWETTVGHLLEFTDAIALQAEKIYRKKGLEFSPDEDTCRFCPAKAVCIARNKWELEHLPELEGNITVLDKDLIKDLYLRRKRIVNWLNTIEKYVIDSVNANGPLAEDFYWAPGARAGNTRWTNEKAVKRFIRKEFPDMKPSDFYSKTLLSPNQMIQRILEVTGAEVGKDLFADQGLTYRPDPKPVLAEREPGCKSSPEASLDLLPDAID